MKIDQLSGFLHNKYTVKSMLDLADLSSSPDAAYRFFYGLYQQEFDVNDRIVLYTSHSIPDELLIHLYQVANFVDISNWFVLICAATDISSQLQRLASSHSTDPVPFQTSTISLENTAALQNNFLLPDTICAIPWMHLEIKNNGTITPCCVSSGVTLGNIKTTTLDQAFTSQPMQQLRSKFLSGQKPVECSKCWNNEKRGLHSIRIHNIKRLKKTFVFNRLSKPTVSSIDIKLNNTCNFKCRICSPAASSLLAAEAKKFLNIAVEPQSDWAESENFINQIIEMLPHLTNIDMYGGEPFLIKKFASVLKIAVEQGYAKNIRLHYNSNGSVWPSALINYWPYFQEVDIHFSIDAIGKRFELQRGGHWNDVENNILQIKNLNLPNLNISLMPTISIMNVYYLDEVYDWAQKHNFKLFAINLTMPSEFSVANLTDEAKQLILDKFKNHPWQEIQNLLAFIRISNSSTGKSFVEKIKWFDSIRQENFAESHNEIAKAMGYSYNNS